MRISVQVAFFFSACSALGSSNPLHLLRRVQSERMMMPRCAMACFVCDCLLRHERAHINVKPFQCTWPGCGYSSARSDDVVKHYRCDRAVLKSVWTNARLGVACALVHSVHICALDAVRCVCATASVEVAGNTHRGRHDSWSAVPF